MQTRIHSAIEIALSTLVGYVVAVGLQCLVFPMFGIYIAFAAQNQIGLVFTAVSLIRGYVMRRAFNAWHHRKR
jgi:hypothetical protein